MRLHKSLVIQIFLLAVLLFWNVLISLRSGGNWVTATALFSALALLILIPFGAAAKNKDDWDDFFSVFILALYPLHSYYLINELHSGLLYSYQTDVMIFLWVPYLFQSLIVINYVYVFLTDYYRQYAFYGITSLSVLNHGLVIGSLTVIIINSIQYQSDKSLLNELIAREIKPQSIHISESPKNFFPHLSVNYSTIALKPNGSKGFLLPIRDRVMMEYQGDLFESNSIEKKAFSNELLFKSPKDTFVVEIIQSF